MNLASQKGGLTARASSFLLSTGPFHITDFQDECKTWPPMVAPCQCHGLYFSIFFLPLSLTNGWQQMVCKLTLFHVCTPTSFLTIQAKGEVLQQLQHQDARWPPRGQYDCTGVDLAARARFLPSSQIWVTSNSIPLYLRNTCVG